MKTQTLQIHSGHRGSHPLLRAAGVKRIHLGWYTVHYRGVTLDCSTICAAMFNPKGAIRQP